MRDCDDHADDDTPPQPFRGEEVDFYVFDVGAGWAALQVSIGPECAGGEYGFSLVFNPLDAIRRFERDLSAGQPARMILPGEPGGAEVRADPEGEEGWVRLRIWLIDFKDDRTLDLDVICPAEAMATSLRTRTGFLAIEHGSVERRTFWQKLRSRFAGT